MAVVGGSLHDSVWSAIFHTVETCAGVYNPGCLSRILEKEALSYGAPERVGGQKDGSSNLKCTKQRADVSRVVFDAVLEEFFKL
jgi:hypothetical protein